MMGMVWNLESSLEKYLNHKLNPSAPPLHNQQGWASLTYSTMELNVSEDIMSLKKTCQSGLRADKGLCGCCLQLSKARFDVFEGAHQDARKRPRFALHNSSGGFYLSFA